MSANYGLNTGRTNYKMSAKLVILPYEVDQQFKYAIYNVDTGQYLTLYSNKVDAEKDLEFILKNS